MIDLSANINRQFLEKFIQRKDVIFTIAILFIGLLIGRATSRNIYKKVELLRAQIESQKKVNVSAAELTSLQEKFNEYKKNIPEDINAFTVLDKINDLARKGNIRLISVTPTEARDKTVYLEYPLSVRLEANYSDLASFIKTLEDQKIFKVLSLDITNSEQGQVPILLSANLSLLAISLKK